MRLKEGESEFCTAGEELSFSSKSISGMLQAVLSKGANFRFRVTGFSMSPFIRDGDVVTVSALLNSVIPLGSSVAFIHPKMQRLAIHRVVDKQNNFYLIKGDNSLRTDGLVRRENILGYVSKIEREGKSVFLGLDLERFLIALLSRAGIFYCLSLVIRLIRFAQNEGSEKIYRKHPDPSNR